MSNSASSLILLVLDKVTIMSWVLGPYGLAFHFLKFFSGLSGTYILFFVCATILLFRDTCSNFIHRVDCIR